MKPDPSAAGVERAFAKACERLAPLHSGASLLLGCSAGGDSMALLDLSAEAAPKRNWKLAVAHFDHAQRPESAEEAALVEGRCRALGLRFVSSRLEAAGGPQRPTEERLRAARYEFFARALAETRSQAVALAHQADDRAETFLMRLISGSGPTGLASIRADDEAHGLRVVRPLLGVRRERLREYLRSRGLGWRDDPTNGDEGQDRAWVRHRLMPMLDERKGADVSARIARASELIEEEEEALTKACALLLGLIVAPEEPPAIERLALRHVLWLGASEGLRRRLMREWLWRLRAKAEPPGFGAVDEALKFAERGAPGARLRTIERIHLEKGDGGLVAYPPEAEVPSGQSSILRS